MSRVKLLVLLALLIGLSLAPAVEAGEEGSPGFDGAPLAIALEQALNSMYASDYQSTIKIAGQAINASVPSDILYIHRKLWSVIRDFSATILSAEENSTVSEGAVYRLYRDEIEMRELLPQYSKALLRYIYDSSLKYKLRTTLEVYTTKLDRVIETKIEEATHLNASSLSINVTLPASAYAGSYVPLTVRLPGNFTLDELRVILMLTTPILDQAYFPAGNKSMVRLFIHIPGAENYTYSYKGNPGKVFVIAIGEYNGSKIELFTSAPINILAMRPRMYFDIPNGVPINHTLEMTVISECDIPLEANVTVTLPGNTTPLLWREETIHPGKTVIQVPTGNLNPGLYTLGIHILPKGKYVEAVYRKAILVEEPEIKASAPPIIIGPPFTAIVRLELGDFNSSGTLIVKGAHTGDNGTRVDPGAKVVELSLGWTTLASSRNVTFILLGSDGRSRAWKTVQITSINILSVVALTTIFSVLSSISARGLRVRLEGLSRAIGRAARIASSRAGETASAIYKAFLSTIARYGIPGESETLREFLNRVASRIRGTSGERGVSALRAFILAYERYLYSKRKPGVNYLRRLLRELVRKLR